MLQILNLIPGYESSDPAMFRRDRLEASILDTLGSDSPICRKIPHTSSFGVAVGLPITPGGRLRCISVQVRL